ncbi:hypothetical protein N7510_003005 [Penicillium lagena]|uniref:uncharacterized protein n=1 Tax=Penicillium lagena TaxID=94218 RepID=UPI00253FFE27|nr:uncharacterized protein N7510_003005 [Penicillium lagena]KAJ5619021.1 hypothetical protein N7510_003005 [Penicillium lagena]
MCLEGSLGIAWTTPAIRWNGPSWAGDGIDTVTAIRLAPHQINSLLSITAFLQLTLLLPSLRSPILLFPSLTLSLSFSFSFSPSSPPISSASSSCSSLPSPSAPIALVEYNNHQLQRTEQQHGQPPSNPKLLPVF